LESKKDKQNEIKNQVNNVLTKHIDVGTTVYVKNEGLLSKLDQRFLGPFTIDSITKNGNYKLKNTENLILDKSYPLAKIKNNKRYKRLRRDFCSRKNYRRSCISTSTTIFS
jgi:hypothetical protein